MDKASSSLQDTATGAKVIVITPDQIKKMGLDQDVKKAAAKGDKANVPDNLILNIRSKLSTLLKPAEKPKPKVVTPPKAGVTYKKIPIKSDGMPMGKLTRITMVKDKTVTTTYADKSLLTTKSGSRPPIDSRILSMRSMLSKKMSFSEKGKDISAASEGKPVVVKMTPEEVEMKTREGSVKSGPNKKIQILSVVPLNTEGNLSELKESTKERAQDDNEESINLENIDFVEDDTVHESKSAVPILHFRNASGAVIEVFQETDTKSDEEASCSSQNTEDNEKREENGSTIEDVEGSSSDSDVDRSQFKSYLKYSKFKRTKPVSGVKIADKTEQLNLQSSKSFTSEKDSFKIVNIEAKLSDEEEGKDIVELKPVPISQRSISNASSDKNKSSAKKYSDGSDLNSDTEKLKEDRHSNEDGLKPILKRKMSAASSMEESAATPTKKGRGRPKKSLSEESTQSKSVVQSPAKKIVKKVQLAADGTPIVKRRGRPPKIWVLGEEAKNTPKPIVEVTSVKTYSKKVPIGELPKTSAIISKIPSMIKLEIDIDGDTSTVVKEEKPESSEEVLGPPLMEKCVSPISLEKEKPADCAQDTLPSVTRKRGRPKKSATPISETPPPKSPQKTKSTSAVSTREIIISRSGRKRKRIDYSAMNEGETNSNDSYAEDEPPPKLDLKDKDFQEFSGRILNKAFEHKMYPAKRKSSKSESDPNENEDEDGDDSIKDESLENVNETTEGSNNTDQNLTEGPAEATDEEVPKKKRGRPKSIPKLTPTKSASDDASTSKKSLVPTSPSKSIPTSKKSDSSPAASIEEQSKNDAGTEQENDKVKAPVQRKKEVSVDSTYACMLNIVSKETDGPHPINIYARTDFSAKAPPAEDRGTVVCALCEAEVPIKSFGRHNVTKHNNLTWTIGEAALDLSNYGLVLGVYTDLYKAKEKFVCDRKCGVTKKSIMGYLSHYIVCQKSVEEIDDMKKNCESCGKAMMPFYYVNHLKDCKEQLPDEIEQSRKTKRNLRSLTGEEKILSMSEVLEHMLDVIKSNKAGVNAINVYLRMDLEDLEKREPPPTGQAICALCNVEMESDTFKKHNLTSHNNLSWKIGEPKLELDKYESVIPTLNLMYTQRHQFNCEQCSASIKSVWGFLWHVATCGKNPTEIEKFKLECPKCQNYVVPTNYLAHTRTCYKVVTDADISPDPNSDEPEKGVKKQRAAATKATKFIRQLTVNDSIKDRRDFMLKFIYVDHQFHKSENLMAFVQNLIKSNETGNCIFENCDFKNEDADLLICHLFTCLKKPKKNFTCKICFAILKSTAQAESHIQVQHNEQFEENVELSADQSADEFGEETIKYKTNKRIRKDQKNEILTPWELVCIEDLQLYKVHFKAKTPLTITKKFTSAFPASYKWNLEFVKQNFSSNLYPSKDSFSNWKCVPPNNITSYLPKLRTSFDITFIKTDTFEKAKQPLNTEHNWTSLKLFEAQKGNDSWTLFCGGPVHSIAWVPVYNSDDDDSTIYNQYLAVSVLSHPDALINQSEIKDEYSIVQIWNFGPLQVNKTMCEQEDFKPHLEYCLAHKHGDYCCLEWSPSGGFDKERRLGLLAVGGTDSFVHIYEMPLGNVLKNHGSIVFEAKAKYKLECMKLTEMNYSDNQTMPVCISWTKAKDHRFVAVGYCSGLIAIFDILTESPHLKSLTADEIIIFKPYLVFVGHAGTVTAISLHHLHGGNRWLATFSLDKTHKLWDLKNISQPISIFTKYHMVDGMWPTHWLATIIAYEDIAVTDRGASTGVFCPIKRFTGIYSYFYNYFTRTNSVAVSDWSNMIAYCNVIGHIMGGFVNSFIPSNSHSRPSVKNFNISFTDVIDKTLSEKEAKERILRDNRFEFNGVLDEISYAPAKKRYGLIFYDSPLTSEKNLEEIRKRRRVDSKMVCKLSKFNAPNIYPIKSATKVAINPNEQAHNFIAVGYQLGFLRIFRPYLYNEKK